MVNDNRKCYIMIQLRRHKEINEMRFPKSFYSSIPVKRTITTIRVKIYLRINLNDRNIRQNTRCWNRNYLTYSKKNTFSSIKVPREWTRWTRWTGRWKKIIKHRFVNRSWNFIPVGRDLVQIKKIESDERERNKYQNFLSNSGNTRVIRWSGEKYKRKFSG